MYDNIYEACKALINIKVDKRFLKDLRKFRIGWSQKSPDYINFLSGNLTGVYPIRFSAIDEEEYFRMIKSDKSTLERSLHKLEGINPEWNVSSNVTFLSLIFLMHEFDKIKDRKVAETGMLELFLIFSFKALGSMFFRFFPHNLNKATATMVFESLNNRYILKKEGSWQKVLEYRAKDVLPGGIYYNRLQVLETEDTGKIAAAIQGSYKSMLIYMYGVIEKVKNKNGSITSTSVIERVEEGTRIKDDINSPSLFISYIKDMVGKTNDFVDPELTYLVIYVSRNISEDLLTDTLKYFSKNYSEKQDYILKQVIEASLSYLRDNNTLEPKKDILKTLNMLKGYWSTGNADNAKLKEELRDIAYRATGRKTSWLKSSLSIAMVLYIFMRALVRK